MTARNIASYINGACSRTISSKQRLHVKLLRIIYTAIVVSVGKFTAKQSHFS